MHSLVDELFPGAGLQRMDGFSPKEALKRGNLPLGQGERRLSYGKQQTRHFKRASSQLSMPLVFWAYQTSGTDNLKRKELSCASLIGVVRVKQLRPQLFWIGAGCPVLILARQGHLFSMTFRFRQPALS